jgi:hypothetical protein
MNQDVLIIASSKIIPTVGRFFIHTENRPTKVCNQIIHHNRSETFAKSHNTVPTNTNLVLTSTSESIPVNTNTTIHSPTLINSSFISHSLLEGGRVKNINLGRSATHSGHCIILKTTMSALKMVS